MYISILRQRLARIQGYDSSNIPYGELINNVGYLKNIQPDNVREQVIGAYAGSISVIWEVCTPMLFVGTVILFFVRGYTLRRQTAGAPTAKKEGEAAPDPEKGPTAEQAANEENSDGQETVGDAGAETTESAKKEETSPV